MPLPWSRFPELGDVRSIEASRRRLRFWLTILAVVLVGVVGLAVALAPRFERNLSARSVREAQVLLQQQDYQRAQLVLEQAVQSNPGDLDARREQARFYGDAGSPGVLALWRELVQLAPGNDADRLELAFWGVRTGDLATAREAMAGLSPAGRSGAEYHRIAAGVALRAGDQKALARELTDLAILEPDNPHAQFNRAAIQLNAGDPTEVGLAREELETLARGGPLRIRATLALIPAVRSEGEAGYQALAEAILPPRSRFTRLFSWSAPPRGLLDLISYMEMQPNPEAADAALLADWMRRQGLVSEAASWLSALSPATQRNHAVLSVRASCLVQLRDWRGLENTLRQGVWGRASDDALDLAFAAYLQRTSNHAEHARDTWGDALDSAGSSLESLHVLLRLAGEVGWTAAAEATLERVVRIDPHETEAWEGLAAIALMQGASGKLYALYATWSKAEPENLEARGGAAWTAAVAHHDWPAASDADDEIRATPGWAAAHALALHAGDRDGEALDGLAALSPEAQADRRVALVRGVLLAGRSRRDESEQALAIGAAGPLLPEESALLQAARTKNGAR
jgi:tetratricopeptide (TPR) repeat protein